MSTPDGWGVGVAVAVWTPGNAVTTNANVTAKNLFMAYFALSMDSCGAVDAGVKKRGEDEDRRHQVAGLPPPGLKDLRLYCGFPNLRTAS
ncbi:hypothetical protein GCM10010140_76220 [Streptosporangium pseudovulgare]|uniref:Uncharacterized protein n=1 Tax=Streptosporangium pseudovulgare TaxID=35765 RepID=A0ABQ2RN32_9ACTN|nr:hypothetical protein GCM10010140_76220 [Streptosporangium pseudovulgare]